MAFDDDSERSTTPSNNEAGLGSHASVVTGGAGLGSETLADVEPRQVQAPGPASSSPKRKRGRQPVAVPEPGQTFAGTYLQFIAEEPVIRDSRGKALRQVRCRCLKCAKEVVVLLGNLRHGRQVSCGCFGAARRAQWNYRKANPTRAEYLDKSGKWMAHLDPHAGLNGMPNLMPVMRVHALSESEARQVVQQLRTGVPGALAKLKKAFSTSPVEHELRRTCHVPDERQDEVQDLVWSQVEKASKNVRIRRSVRAWISTITKATGDSYMKHRPAAPVAPQPPDIDIDELYARLSALNDHDIITPTPQPAGGPVQ